jgi:hypothetical protein
MAGDETAGAAAWSAREIIKFHTFLRLSDPTGMLGHAMWNDWLS